MADTATPLPEILEGTGWELSDHFKRMGSERVRVMIMPDPLVHHRSPLDEFDAAMDAIGQDTDSVPVDPTVTYNREDIYADHD